jgi:choline dehydrogenase-like flavoprotein
MERPIPEECDVCVIGSGAGGACAAYSLAQAGFRTVLLEKGIWRDDPRWEANKDNDELYARLRKTPHPSDQDITNVKFEGEDYKPQFMGQGFGVVGGATVFYAATEWRFREQDFKKESLYGDKLRAICNQKKWAMPDIIDWPGGNFYAELEKYYCIAEKLLGVSGDWEADPTKPFRSEATYLPPLPFHQINEILSVGAKRLGYHPFHIPMGISSIKYPVNDLEPCVSCNYCSGYPCVWNSKNSVDVALLMKIRNHQNLVIATNVSARRIEHEHGECRAVTYSTNDSPTEKPRRLNSRIIVLAAGGILSPRLLMLSGLDQTSNAVGRYLMFHLDEKREAIFPDVFEPGSVMVKKLAVMDRYFPSEDDQFINHCSIQTGSKGGPIAFSTRKPLPDGAWGESYLHSLRDYNRYYEVQAIVEDMPRRDNRVELDAGKLDRFGDKCARVTHEYHPMDKVAVYKTLEHIEELLRSSGGQPVGDRTKAPKPSGSHLMGTLRMGTSPENSAVDIDCRLHGMKNLFVADGSVFSTSAGLNPALTIQANAFRVADRIIELHKAGKL